MGASPFNKAGWEQALQDLSAQIRDWVTKEDSNKMTFEQMSPVPQAGDPFAQVIVNGRTVFYLEPAEFTEHRVPTVAFLYAFPTLRRVQLRGPSAGAWEVLTSEGIPMSTKWNQFGFIKLLTDLSYVPNSKGA